ncbi:hypothetical protein [Salininema proteolyticum]|uniref:Septum formation-related domain-containing protein n=1 Tax=Salininema proteolyticum TaxID=1607685 RepID=A0ABV8TV17_9ACTN
MIWSFMNSGRNGSIGRIVVASSVLLFGLSACSSNGSTEDPSPSESDPSQSSSDADQNALDNFAYLPPAEDNFCKDIDWSAIGEMIPSGFADDIEFAPRTSAIERVGDNAREAIVDGQMTEVTCASKSEKDEVGESSKPKASDYFNFAATTTFAYASEAPEVPEIIFGNLSSNLVPANSTERLSPPDQNPDEWDRFELYSGITFDEQVIYSQAAFEVDDTLFYLYVFVTPEFVEGETKPLEEHRGSGDFPESWEASDWNDVAELQETALVDIADQIRDSMRV